MKNGAAARVVVKTVDEFRQQVVESKQPVVVDFFATWCGPCKLLAPILDKLEEEYAGGVKFVAVDVDQANELARRHNIEGVPTLEFYRDGKLAGRVVGLEPESRLRQRVAGLLSGS